MFDYCHVKCAVVMCMLVMFCCVIPSRAVDVFIEDYDTSHIISKDEELERKSIGPFNKYELINSFSTMYSTDREKKMESLPQIYDYSMYE